METLGIFEQAVLLAVLRLGSEAYGRPISKEVSLRLERSVTAGAVYATLDRLEEKALISSRLGTGTPARAGRPRRYYSIEHAGVRALNKSKSMADNMWNGFRWPLKAKS